MIHYDLHSEWPMVLSVTQQIGIDPLYMVAIRIAENGRPGLDYGVLDNLAVSYDLQLTEATKTIRRYLVEFLRNPFCLVQTDKNFRRLSYSQEFIISCGKRYAPTDAINDPTGLNKNWPKNVSTNYYKFCKSGWDLKGPWELL